MNTRDYMGAEALLRSSRDADLAWITALERNAENRELIGQWSAVWLLVRKANHRAQAVYTKLPFVPDEELGKRLGLAGDSPFGEAIAMRLDLSAWRQPRSTPRSRAR